MKGITVSLDFTAEVLSEGLERGVNLFVTHHPLFFRPLTKLSWDAPQGRLIKEAAAAGVSVYALHTNLDNARGGLNCWLAEELGAAASTTPLARRTLWKSWLSLCPKTRGREGVMNAWPRRAQDISANIATALPGPRQRTFKPLRGLNPYIGKLMRSKRWTRSALRRSSPVAAAKVV